LTHIIAAGRVFLRPFEAADAEIYRRWRADDEPMALAAWRQPGPLSLAQVEQRIARLTEDQGKGSFAFLICLADDERPIGEVMLMDIDRVNGSAEVGIFIGESAEWGNGYGTEAVGALVDFGFAELRLERIWLEVSAENPRARRSYEKVGFVGEATLRHDLWTGGRFIDGEVMSILHGEWQSRRS
jgi:RimJ/RimL family protein N-acetyltransferase